MPFVIAVGHHSQLLALGKYLEVERSPAPQEVHQGCEQRNKYCFHTGKATWSLSEKSRKSWSTELLAGTGNLFLQFYVQFAVFDFDQVDASSKAIPEAGAGAKLLYQVDIFEVT